MAQLEDLTKGTSVKGVLPDALVTVVDVKWVGTVAIDLTYKDALGRLGNELLSVIGRRLTSLTGEGVNWQAARDALATLKSKQHFKSLPADYKHRPWLPQRPTLEKNNAKP